MDPRLDGGEEADARGEDGSTEVVEAPPEEPVERRARTGDDEYVPV